MSYRISEACIGCTSCAAVCPTGAVSGEKCQRHVIRVALCMECGYCARACAQNAIVDSDGRPVGRERKFRRPKPVILAQRCQGCGQCVAVCPTGALALAAEGRSPARVELIWRYKCTACGRCVAECPADAILLERGLQPL